MAKQPKPSAAEQKQNKAQLESLKQEHDRIAASLGQKSPRDGDMARQRLDIIAREMQALRTPDDDPRHEAADK